MAAGEGSRGQGLRSAPSTILVRESNPLLVPLDRRGEWYRYHRLFRDMLLAELDRREPGLIPVLLRRAAAWHERNGSPGQALAYWMAAGDADAVARLASRVDHGRV